MDTFTIGRLIVLKRFTEEEVQLPDDVDVKEIRVSGDGIFEFVVFITSTKCPIATSRNGVISFNVTGPSPKNPRIYEDKFFPAYFVGKNSNGSLTTKTYDGISMKVYQATKPPVALGEIKPQVEIQIHTIILPKPRIEVMKPRASP
jgi:hypothetical protein